MDASPPFLAPSSPPTSSSSSQSASSPTPSPSESITDSSNNSSLSPPPPPPPRPPPPPPPPPRLRQHRHPPPPPYSKIIDSKIVAPESSPVPALPPAPPQQINNASAAPPPATPKPIASALNSSKPIPSPDRNVLILAPPPSSYPLPQPGAKSPANVPSRQSSPPPPPQLSPPQPPINPPPPPLPKASTPLSPHKQSPPKPSPPKPSPPKPSPPKPSPPRPAPHPSPTPHHSPPPTRSPSNHSQHTEQKISPSNASPKSTLSKSTLSSIWNSSSSHNSSVVGAVAGGTVAAAIIVVIAILFLLLRKRKSKKSGLGGQYNPPPNSSSLSSGVPSDLGNTYPSLRGPGYRPGLPDSAGSHLWFTYDELQNITNGFSLENLIGEGGFGCVYKGCLTDGRTVAVKQLKVGSGQGDKEFRAEVEIISRVHHRHLVSLVGYCISDHQRLLVYEYLPNRTLEYHLHEKGLPVMDWSKRVKIAIGSARGLAYLHEDCHPRIIHRDIKSANILLDNCFEAQVSDFGLAKPSNDAHSHVSTRVVGTFGYMAPEYASSGKLTDRSDVYSFGVVLLELITGRKPVDTSQPLGDESLVEWVRPRLVHALETGEWEEFVDPRLEQNFVKSEMLLMIEAAAACVRHAASKRPRMAQVVRALDNEGDLADLSNGMKFGHSQVFNSAQYSAEIRMFHGGSLESDEYSTDSYEYSGEHDRRMSSAHSIESSTSNSPRRFRNNTTEGNP